jgi:hypothetical protein
MALAPVAIVAVLALFRTRKKLLVVASLALWQEALSASAAADKRKAKRMTLAWLLLLCGAIAAVLAIAGPTLHSAGPVRSVAIVLHPSAELGAEGIGEMKLAAGTLLDRLGPDDRVQVVGPEILGAPSQWISPDQARVKLTGLKRLNVSAGGLRVGRPAPQAASVYHFSAGLIDIPEGPNVKRIGVATHLPELTIDVIGAEKLVGDKVQVFVALRNHTDKPITATVTANDAVGSGPVTDASTSVTVRPGSSQAVSVTVAKPDSGAICVTASGAGSPKCQGYLALNQRGATPVAIIGRDDPYLRRFVQVDPTLRLVSQPGDAKIIIANGVAPPAGKPSLVIAPPAPPAPWRLSRADISGVMLAQADTSADDPIMRSVRLDAAAVRTVRPWAAGEVAGAGVLIAYKGSVLAVRTPDDADASQPRQVSLAFDLSENNCTLVRSEAYVVFLANVMRYLAPGSAGQAKYEYLTPLQAGANPTWKPIRRAETLADRSLTSPGIYLDPDSQAHAVCLPGLRSSSTSRPPVEAARRVALPQPKRSARGYDLSTILLLAAGLFWLAGWTASTLRD